MSTTEKGKAVVAPKPPEQAEPAPPSDIERLDAWVLDVRNRIQSADQAKGKVGLRERLLAMQWELSKVKPEAVHFQGYTYHSIQSVENHVSRLTAIYRVHITPTRVGSVVLEGGVRLHLQLTAFCSDTDEHVEWQWEDDGEDLTKAGSYTQKYALMKFFHMGDGQDPDAEAARGKPQRGRQASTSQARTAAPTGNGNTGTEDPVIKEGLYLLARSLPPTAGWAFKDDGANIKIDAMLKSKMDPSNIRSLLVEAHKKAHGANCEHVASEPAATEPPADQPATDTEPAS